ncbi:hypothetical protein [Caenibius sp. WL]|uniref:hypothetical protein n=1 Tax=Caenibius sp. WL TaxID=2872646 RepID=UPI001C9933CC|nr:hypothetical protein [Caenibius sp. WL]QZP08196.1 hypothetical protein K5X80_16445 [Caenibius sp. WL]
MAGIKAGRDMDLQIKMIMDLQDLVKGAQEAERIMKSTGANISQGMSAADHAVAEAGVSMARLRREAQALKDRLDPLAPAQRRYAQELKNANAMLATGMIDQRQYAQAVEFAEQKLDEQTLALQRNRVAGQQVNAANGAQRAGMQQLSMQLNDAATMWMLGASKMQIFASQGGQVVQALQLMTGSSKGLIGFLGGPWGMVLTTATMVLTPFIAKLFESKNAADAAADSYRSAAQAARELAGTENAIKLATAQGELNDKRSRLLAVENQLSAGRGKSKNTRYQSDNDLLGSLTTNALRKERLALKQEILERESVVALAEDMNVKLAAAQEKAAKSAEKKTGKTREASAATRAHNAALAEAKRAYDQQIKSTDSFIASLQDEIARIGLDEKALRQLQVSRELDAAKTDAQKQKIIELNKVREEAIKLQEQREQTKQARAATGDLNKELAQLEREVQVLEDVGWARDKNLLRMEREAAIREKSIGAAIAEAAGNKKLADELRAQIPILETIYGLKIQMGDRVEQVEEERDAAERLNNELREMISLLQDIGGVAGVLGGILGFVTGNDGALRGPIGALLRMGTGKTEIVNGEKVAVTIGDELRKVLGSFGDDLAVMLKGAATGTLAANAVLGNQGTSGQIGSMLGGAAGQALGTKFLGALGSFAGPLGSIAGGIIGGMLGGIVGSVFKSTKWGRADISGVGDANIRYRSNSGKYEGPVNDAANAVIKGLNSIAEQLGGVAGEFGSIAIGIRDGKYRVNPNGKSLKVSAGAKDFGEDSAAAIAYAIQMAVQKGAISGINQSVLNLLQASGDFEEQLSKAAQLQGIFAEIAQAADPMGYELEQLAKRFTSIRALLAEANATPEEQAKVDAYQKQQEAAIRQRYAEEANARRAAQLEKEAELLLLQGKASQALAKTREAELIQLNAAEQAIQKQIYAETDLATKRALQIQLLEAQGNAEAAKAAQRAEELRSTLDDNKAMQQRIWLTQDLADAYNRESDGLRSTIDEMKGLGDTLKEFRRSIYAADGGAMSYTQALAKWIQTQALAATGDKKAMGDLPNIGRDFLDVAKNSAKSMLEYKRAQALVANGVDQAIRFADNAASEAEQQLALMKSQAESLISIDENLQSFEDALNKLIAHNQATAAPSPAPSPASDQQTSENLKSGFSSMKEAIDAMRREFLDMRRTLGRFSEDGVTLDVNVKGGALDKVEA